MTNLDHGDTKVLAWLKARYRGSLQRRARRRPKAALAAAGVAVLMAAVAVPFFPTTFLPPFNEGTLLIGLRLNPGVTLSETSALARQAEVLVKQVPEVDARRAAQRAGRAGRTCRRRARQRTGRGPEAHGRTDAQHGRRSRPTSARAWSTLPAALEIGQPISHRIDHMLSGVRSQIAIKIFGEDLDALRGQADAAARASWPRSPASPTCRSRSRCWRRRSRCASTTPPRRSTACRRRRC